VFQDNPQISISKTGERLYLRHGPIDLFIEIETHDHQMRIEGFKIAVQTFKTILPELCEELASLRKPISCCNPNLKGPIAQKMFGAASVFSKDHFVTPMIAVAGSVADHLLERVSNVAPTNKIYINNGGDISLKIFGDKTFKVGICSDVATGTIETHAEILPKDNTGGIATSGWAGRSHSLGIADAVTVFAKTAAMADTAATLIANAVDLPASDKVERMSADTLSPDSDLGSRLVTTGVSTLTEFEKEDALQKGFTIATNMQDQGLIHSAYLALQGRQAIVPTKNHISINQFTYAGEITNRTGSIYA